jgi:hypothetical protein
MMFGVDLHALGVPSGARLLRVEWWTDDSSRPPEMPEFAGSVYVMGQNALPTPLRPTGDALMFEVAASQDQSFEGVDVVLYITWAQPGIERETGLLVRAFDAFIAGAIDDAIVPANTAVEIVVNRTVRDTVHRHAASTARNKYSDSRIDYGDKLDYLLPAFAALYRVPPMPEEVSGKLRRLRRLRNDVSHGQSLDRTISQELPDLLVSALLAVEYVRLVERAARTGDAAP